MNMFGMMWTLHFSSHILRPGLRHFLVHPHWLASLNTITHIIHCQWYVMRKFTGNKVCLSWMHSVVIGKVIPPPCGRIRKGADWYTGLCRPRCPLLTLCDGQNHQELCQSVTVKVGGVLHLLSASCWRPPLSKRQDSNGREGCKYSRRKLHFRVMRLPLCLHYLFLWK